MGERRFAEGPGAGMSVAEEGGADASIISDRSTLFWVAGFLGLILVNTLWTRLNDHPPVWDMAHHQKMGWEYLLAWQRGSLLQDISSISNYYPPLYYIQEALVFRLFGPSKFVPLLSNLPGLFLLSFFTFRTARLITLPWVSLCSGMLVLLFPLVAWTSREALLDCSLSGWVILGLFLVLRSQNFVRRAPSLAFGLVCAAGMLTKWTYVLFLFPALVFALLRSSARQRSLLNLFYSAIIAVPLILPWYLPNLDALINRFGLTAAGAVWEEDPGLTSFGGWLYYVRSLSSYYLFLPLTAVVIASIWMLVRNTRWSERLSFLVATMLGGVVLLTLLPAKDPRYVMPLASSLSILMLYPFARRPYLVGGLIAFAFLQFLSVSFSLPLAPGKIALRTVANDTDYIGMSREWVFYEPNYFGVTGPPRKEDWQFEAILEPMKKGDRVGFIPDAPFFHPAALELQGLFLDKALRVQRVGNHEVSEESILSLDWVVGKTGFQGISFITRFNEQAYDVLEKLDWRLVEKLDLPDQSKAILWQNPYRSP